MDISFQAGNKPLEIVGNVLMDQLGCGAANNVLLDQLGCGGVELDDVTSGKMNH